MPKADLHSALANAGGGTRRRAAAQEPAPQDNKPRTGKPATKPITVHFPEEVRSQLKIMAVEQGTTMHKLIAEAYNDLFAKYGKPEIAPLDGKE